MGLMGLAMSAGATFSTSVAGFVTEHLGTRIAFVFLAAMAGTGCLLVSLALPETRHAPASSARIAAGAQAA
jgi:MFS family permease